VRGGHLSRPLTHSGGAALRAAQWEVNATLLQDEPLYTESNWPADIGASIFLRDSHSHELSIFACGFTVTALTGLLTYHLSLRLKAATEPVYEAS
jgi:hypothetical protein